MRKMSTHAPILAHVTGCQKACKSCHYKNLNYPEQLERKQRWANEQLGQWQSVLDDIEPARLDEQIGYRSKSWLWAITKQQLSFGMRRAVFINGEWQKEYLSWDDCPIHSTDLRASLAAIKSQLTTQLSPLEIENLVGIWFGAPHVVLVFRESTPAALGTVDWASAANQTFTSVWTHENNQVGRKIFGHKTITLIYSKPDVDTQSRAPIRAFRQVAQRLLHSARMSAAEFLLESKPEMILELYSGCGDFAALLPAVINWVGIEMSREACNFANGDASVARLIHRAFTGAVEQRLNDPELLKLLNPFSHSLALYLNPPRSGLSDSAKQKIGEILENHKIARIAYLSCSASSLARDLEFFCGHQFKVETLKPFDFFPQTEHFETLATLRRFVP